jgi:LemA protein
MLIWIVVALVVLVAAIAILLYNRLTTARNRTQTAWGDVDAELKRRADLVPELNDAVASYAEHERTVIDAAAQARAEATGDDPASRSVTERRLGSAIGGVIGVAEAYPELRASERFAQLQHDLAQSEDRIALARMVYNDTVQTYNASIEQLPASLLAGALGFRRRALFELADGRG